MTLIKPTRLGRFQIARNNRTTFEGEAGYEDCDLDKVEDLMVEELHVRRELAAAKKLSDDGLTVNAWLKVTCYQIILALLTEDEGERLFARLENHKRFVRGTQVHERDAFQEGVVAIFARNARVLEVADRKRIADPLWYAFRHYIPHPLLDGFSRQYPAHVAKEAGWRTRIEPSLRGWVVDQRAYSQFRSCSLDVYRGTYPIEIEEAVSAELDKTNGALISRQRARIQTSLKSNDEDWPD